MYKKNYTSILVLAFSLLIVGSIVNGWALSLLWRWFVAPQFGLPALTVVQAIGVGLTINLLITHSATSADTRGTAEKIGAAISESIARPLLAVVIGAIVKIFM